MEVALSTLQLSYLVFLISVRLNSEKKKVIEDQREGWAGGGGV